MSNSYHGEPYIPADVFNVSLLSCRLSTLGLGVDWGKVDHYIKQLVGSTMSEPSRLQRAVHEKSGVREEGSGDRLCDFSAVFGNGSRLLLMMRGQLALAAVTGVTQPAERSCQGELRLAARLPRETGGCVQPDQ